MIRVLSRIKSQPWAVTRETMETILDIASRDNATPEAVAAKLGRPLENTYDVEMRGSVGVMHVTGPLFRYANLFTAISGATSYDMLATDFGRLVEDPAVSSILLVIDSPGGEVDGVSEFAAMIYAARGRKPVVAYVDGMAASAGYWLASAASEIVVNDTALLGSIGTVFSVTDSREADAKAGRKRYDIVSSQSPYKRVDIATDEGRGRLQATADAVSDVFIDKVALYRGVSRETVLSDFGQGDVLVGQAAVAAGMADRIGSFEQVIAELQGGRAMSAADINAAAGGHNREDTMSATNGAPAADPKPSKLTADQVVEQHPEAAQALQATARADGESAGRKAERERISAILDAEQAQGREGLAKHLAFGTDTAPDAALALLDAAPKAEAPKAGASFDSFNAAMNREGNPNVGADAAAGNDSDDTTESAIKRSAELGKLYGVA